MAVERIVGRQAGDNLLVRADDKDMAFRGNRLAITSQARLLV